ncbi:MAG TPA: MlaD family protein [Solirubrobacteraceae bacterium]|nr:MlaD family protein [Solirubrobacteraceae bacterium]
MALKFGRHSDVPVRELQRRVKPVRIGVITIVALIVISYFAITKSIPFTHNFQLKAQFESAINIKSKSPVRIAGVDVGEVTSIKREGSTALVSMEIEEKGLPIHEDATLKIRPRIFLEGNWFVELQPGTPSSPSVSSGHTIPIDQTADPVQLDQVLDALNTDTRHNLQVFLIEYGAALTKKPTAAENAEQEAEVRGLDASQALNRVYKFAPEAERGTAIVNQALGGVNGEDLTKLVASIGKVTAALNVHEQALGELIVNFDTFFRSFANQSASLARTVQVLPGALTSVDHGLSELQASFGPTQRFAKDILPGVRETPATVTALLPWIKQLQAALGPQELGGVASALKEAAPTLAELEAQQIPLYKQTELFNRCLTKLIYPAGNTKLQDGTSTTGEEAYKEFWYGLTGLAGLGQSFTGNGSEARFLLSSGTITLKSKPTQMLGFPDSSSHARLLAHSAFPPLGTSPAYPSKEPPYEPKVQCDKQKLPDFNGPLAHGPADGS